MRRRSLRCGATSMAGGASVACRGPRTPAPTRSSTRRWTGCADPVVVAPHQRDHVLDVRPGLDTPRGGPDLAREHRVLGDPPGLVQLVPHVLGEEEMGGVIAVEVPDLPGTELECPFAAAPVAGLDAGPGGDLVGDMGAG